jgi:hypothetical protein
MKPSSKADRQQPDPPDGKSTFSRRVPGVVRKSTGRTTENLYLFALARARFCGDSFLFGLFAQASSHRAEFHPLGGVNSDHFQPQYRMAFAVNSSFKRALFFSIWRLFLPGDSLVNSLIRSKLRQRRDLKIQKGTEGSNPLLSATQSELQRKFARFDLQQANNACISR